MQRSKLHLFEKGDQLICIHDCHDLCIADVVTVVDICDDCLGLKLEGHQIHYQDINFDKYSPEKKFHFQMDPDKIDKQKVANVFNDIIKVMVLNSHRGVFEIDPVINAIKHNVMVLGIRDQFMKPLNQPEE